MGKISSLPEDVRQELIGYLAQPGIITSITVEVPKKKCAEFAHLHRSLLRVPEDPFH